MARNIPITFATAIYLILCCPKVDAARPTFKRDVLPILKAKCLGCHGGKKTEGELDLRSLPNLLKGGASGVVVRHGKSQESLLLKRIVAGEMPPKGAKKLTKAEVTVLKNWIDVGLQHERSKPTPTNSKVTIADRQFWSFRRLKRPAIPVVQNSHQIRTPIDAFVLARLEVQRLQFSSDAKPLRIIRRLYFDLLGLPPSPADVREFLADTSVTAYERLVDRLLASPHFGERWGRHWLDTVGYTDTVSYDGDTNFVPGFIKGRWRYRDYVIQAFNSDKPYDAFLTEQIAGDELVRWRTAKTRSAKTVSLLAATGFWRNAEDRSASAKEIEYKWSLLHDTMQTFGTSVLGLTLRCARCHSHKHEPIPQENYYQLLSTITPAFNIQRWKDPKQRALPTVTAAERKSIDASNARIDKQLAQLTKQLAALKKKAGLSGTEKARLAKLQKQIAKATNQKRSYGWIQAVYDVGPPPPTYLLVRGDFKRPGRQVQPGFLSVLSESSSKISALPASSGRRTALARWLTKRDTPAASLVSRVMVNRIWQHLTGVGIVPSSENLGRSGNRPTHPDLLEHLAWEFVDSGWRIKPLIKQIVMSSVYRQSSRPSNSSSKALAIDPGNRLLWRARLRRLEAEAIRDAMLEVSGMFDRRLHGRAVPLHYRKDGLVSFDDKQLTSASEKWRRSVYLFHRRVYHLTVLGVFDQPVVAGSTCRRNSSAVALQSLSMLNDKLVLAAADKFADRVLRLAGNVRDQQIHIAFRIALGRAPAKAELKLSQELLASQAKLYPQAKEPAKVKRKALMHLCRVLLNTSEFLYVE